jgi:hypothetical protein
MPEIFRIEGYVCFFYSNEGNEPVHVHVRKAGGYAKFWMEPIVLEYAKGMKTQELTRAEALILENRARIFEKWNEAFNR